MKRPEWLAALDARDDISKFGDTKLGLFALALRFGVDDLESTAADAITDGSDDKKCDLVFIEQEQKFAVLAQCYWSKQQRKEAPANKAADLNTAIAWLLQRPLKDLPARIKPQAKALRAGLEDGSIATLFVWYVHNLPASKNVENELRTVESTADTVLKKNFGQQKIKVHAEEVSSATIESWYVDSKTAILVSDSVEIPIDHGFSEITEKWQAFVTTVAGKTLAQWYKQHKKRLFSANVRDYLGSRQADANINNGIRLSAESRATDFWVFNNGLTILCNDFNEIRKGSKRKLVVDGLSIVNGAQTTGALGTLARLPDDEVRVPVRFVCTEDPVLVHEIIRYNNSQNRVTASDFRSTDRTQKRLREEFKLIPNAEYEGGRRGGETEAIVRRKNLLSSYTVGQALAAFHGQTVIAYNSKSEIWVDDGYYSHYFNEHTTARHIVFVYGLWRAVEELKVDLVMRSRKDEGSLTTDEAGQLAFFRTRGAIPLAVTGVASCLEALLGRRVSSPSRLAFGQKTSPLQAESNWSTVVKVLAPLMQQLTPAFTDGLKSQKRVDEAVRTFQQLVKVTLGANRKVYESFGAKVTE